MHRQAVYVITALWLALGAAAPAPAKEGGDHVCPQRNPPPSPAGPAGNTVTKPAVGSVQVMGCLERGYPLRKVRLKGAKHAVAVAAEPGSVAALFAYKTSAERDALIVDWASRWADESAQPSKPMTFYLAGHVVSAWQLPDGSSVGVIYPEKGELATLCVIRANVSLLPDAQPVLNNWCMDRMALWRKD